MSFHKSFYSPDKEGVNIFQLHVWERVMALVCEQDALKKMKHPIVEQLFFEELVLLEQDQE